MLIALVMGGLAWREFTHAAVEVEWTTASELSTVGFDLYRSDSQEGVYQKVNDELIPASPDPLTGGSYTYLDAAGEAGCDLLLPARGARGAGERDALWTDRGASAARRDARAGDLIIGAGDRYGHRLSIRARQENRR